VDRATVEQAIGLLAATATDRRAAWDALDGASGDGDFGSTLARGFARVLERRQHGGEANSPAALLDDTARILIGEMGGTSGPLWGVAFLRAARVLGDASSFGVEETATMLEAAVDGIREYGDSDVGDKTLLDALVPAARATASAAKTDPPLQVLERAAQAAVEGASATRDLPARRGRASYAGERSVGTPDPGAVAIAVIAAELVRAAGGTAPEIGELETTRASIPTDEGVEAPPTPTKQFVDDAAGLVGDSLRGLALAHPELVAWDDSRRIVRRADGPAAGLVGLVSGGGSGHEPMHAGFVGDGMLTAVAPGQVFASPSVEQLLDATRAADAGAGVLQIVKNYTGDRINFGLAAELARTEGISVASVVVDDDVAIAPSEQHIGGRGTGATVLVEKLAGALAQQGGTLAHVEQVARRVVGRSASFGVALTSCSLPGGGPILELGPEEIEVGVGIHGETGRRRDSIRPAAEIVDEIAETLIGALRLDAGARVLGFVSGLGATPLIQQQMLFAHLVDRLRAAGLVLAKGLVGPYLTALDMAGVVITLLELDDELESLWDAPVVTPGLRWGA
jgi:dihydroxyacetone kinase phosphoprotein-dependent L subunit